MPTKLIELLIEKLDSCPCCMCSAHETNGPEDGIPDDYVHETVFQCGARICVTDEGDYRVSTGCPYPADDRLQDIRRDVEDELEELEEGALADAERLNDPGSVTGETP